MKKGVYGMMILSLGKGTIKPATPTKSTAKTSNANARDKAMGLAQDSGGKHSGSRR